MNEELVKQLGSLNEQVKESNEDLRNKMDELVEKSNIVGIKYRQRKQQVVNRNIIIAILAILLLLSIIF